MRLSKPHADDQSVAAAHAEMTTLQCITFTCKNKFQQRLTLHPALSNDAYCLGVGSRHVTSFSLCEKARPQVHDAPCAAGRQ